MTNVCEHGQLKEFAIWVLNHTFDGYGIDCDEAQIKAMKLGFLKEEIFNPDIHNKIINGEILEPGDVIYLFTDKLKVDNNE